MNVPDFSKPPRAETARHQFSNLSLVIAALLATGTALEAANYQNKVFSLRPTYYYELNETDTAGGAVDSMGNAAANGVYNGSYLGGGPMVGIPGPIVVFNPDDPNGTLVPGVGGEDNLAHLSNNAGHITLGPGADYGANAMTVALFLKAGQGAQGGDRVFTNNLTDGTKSFQINIGNNGLVLAVDPNDSGLNSERTLYMEDGASNDRRLLDESSGWFHIVASTEGATGVERAANLQIWVNGVDRTENLMPDSTGWGTDTGMAKIGGRRASATDTTTHSGGQDEVAIWLNRVLTGQEAMDLWEAALVESSQPFTINSIDVLEGVKSNNVTLSWQSRPNRSYSVFSSDDLQTWIELTDGVPSAGEETSFTEEAVSPEDIPRFYKVAEASG